MALDHILVADRRAARKSGRLTDKIELKINMEALTRCGGSCGGCLLSADERIAGQVWRGQPLADATRFVARFVEEQSARHAHITEISLNFGQGDYFLIPASAVRPLVAAMRTMGGGRAIAFITASAVTNPRQLERMLDAFYDAAAAEGQALLIDLVLDPVKTTLASFAETYADNITAIRRRFGGVDLNLNIGPDTVAAVTPVALHRFLAQNRFGIGTLNLVPTAATAAAFARDWPAIVDWLIAFARAWTPRDDGHEINLFATAGKAIEAAARAERAGGGAATTLGDVAAMMGRELYIDHQGWVSVTQAGIGDGPLGRRNGWTPAFTVAQAAADPGPVLALTDAQAQAYARRAVRPFLRDATCAACSFAAVCARSGVAAYRGVMEQHLTGPDGDGCPIHLRRYFQALADVMATGQDLCSTAYSALTTFVQRGFASPLIQQPTELIATDAPVRFV